MTMLNILIFTDIKCLWCGVGSWERSSTCSQHR